MRHPLLLPLSLVAFSSIGCGATVKATAPNVINPVLLGPVERVGGGRGFGQKTNGTFVVELTDSAMSAGLSSFRVLGNDPKNVSFWVLRSTGGDASLDAHVDRVTAGGRCLFALIYGECDERATLTGTVTKHVGVADAPARITEESR